MDKDKAIEQDKLIDEEIHKGIIINLKNSYGFIRNSNREGNVFFHAKGVIDLKFNELSEGMEVEYSLTQTPKGLKAIGVVAI